jgi:hypothetical protein
MREFGSRVMLAGPPSEPAHSVVKLGRREGSFGHKAAYVIAELQGPAAFMEGCDCAIDLTSEERSHDAQKLIRQGHRVLRLSIGGLRFGLASA